MRLGRAASRCRRRPGPGGVPPEPPRLRRGRRRAARRTARGERPKARWPGDGDTSGQVVIRLQNADENPRRLESLANTAEKQPVVTNPGTNAHDLTPITLSTGATTVLKRKIPPPRAGSSFTSVPAQGKPGPNDQAVSQASYQGNGTPAQPAQGAGSGMQTESRPTARAIQDQPAAPSPDLSGLRPAVDVGGERRQPPAEPGQESDRRGRGQQPAPIPRVRP